MEQTMKQNVISGFKATGTFPYDKLQVLKKLPETSSLQETTSNDQENIPSTSLLDYLKTTRPGSKAKKKKPRRKNGNATVKRPKIIILFRF